MGTKRWRTSAAAVVSGLIATSASVVAVLSPAGATPAPAARRELVYVANADAGPVTAYSASSHGTVAPVQTVANPRNPATVWDPWGITFDRSGHLYVQTFLSDATSFVFAPGAHGAAGPVRIFKADGPDNRAIAVDVHGYEYVVGGEGDPVISVEPPGASGSPGDLYAVPPVRTITLGGGFTPWPGILAVETGNEVLAAVTGPQGNAIEFFRGGAGGGSTPVRVISGPRTGLGDCDSFIDCDHLSIAFSRLTGRIYAAVSAGGATHISVFAGTAAGDARPVRTIEGPATGLSGKVITGIACSQVNGTIYAMVKTSQFGRGRVDAYRRLAAGDSRPLSSFTDRRSGFADAAALAVI